MGIFADTSVCTLYLYESIRAWCIFEETTGEQEQEDVYGYLYISDQ